VVVDGADRLRPGQIVIASVGRQRGGQAAGQTATGQAGGGPFATPNATSGQGRPGAPAAGKDNGKHEMKEQQ
jgi:hypothetical protein